MSPLTYAVPFTGIVLYISWGQKSWLRFGSVFVILNFVQIKISSSVGMKHGFSHKGKGVWEHGADKRGAGENREMRGFVIVLFAKY
jgi:hypothetical protein